MMRARVMGARVMGVRMMRVGVVGLCIDVGEANFGAIIMCATEVR